LLTVLRGAGLRDKAELYSRIGRRMSFKPGPMALTAEMVSTGLGRVLDVLAAMPALWAQEPPPEARVTVDH
jgi:hypothetical protein